MEEKKNKDINKETIKKVFAGILVTLSFVAVFICGYFSYLFLNVNSTSLTGSVINLINNQAYLIDPETGEQKYLTEEEISDLIIDYYFDKYSEYYTLEEYQSVSDTAAGNNFGAGLVFYNDRPQIYKVVGNSPADRAGMEVGDVINFVEVGGVKIIAQSGSRLADELNAIDGSKQVTFNVTRAGEQKIFSLVRADYTVSYVTYYDNQTKLSFRADKKSDPLSAVTDDNKKMSALDDKTAYIKLDLFEGDCVKQMKQALDFMKSRGREKLILDLRDNGGGSLDYLIEIGAMLIYNQGKNNTVIAYAHRRNGNETFTTGQNKFYDNLKEISIIANDGTASASECLIGAMLHYQDGFNKDRLIIEKNNKGNAVTYGKGIMQTTYWLAKGGALKITTGKMFWPDDKTSIHGVGITTTEQNSVESANALSRAIACLSE